MTFACEVCGVSVEVEVRRGHRYCAECKRKVFLAGKARSNKKNAARARASEKRWREANRERVRETERRRPDRREYHRRKHTARRWAEAAKRMEHVESWLALPAPAELLALPAPRRIVVARAAQPIVCVAVRRFVAGPCLECGEVFMALPTRAWADRYCCKAHRDRNHRRRDARKRRAARRDGERIDLATVAVRDGWRCHICNRKVTRKTWSLDHLIPLADDGPHTYENVALAHHRCNSIRGARGAAQLLLVA